MMNRQYWRSADPAAYAAVARREAAYAAFADAVRAFDRGYGVRAAVVRNPFTGGLEANSVYGDTARLPGWWTKPDSRGRSYPFRRNREGRRMLDALAWEPTPIPGLPRASCLRGVFDGVNLPTAAFTHDGAAYACTGVGEPFFDDDKPVDENLWTRTDETEYENTITDRDDG